MALTSTGLEIRRLPEIISAIVAALQTNINPNINVDDDTLIGQLTSVFGQFIAEEEALAQAVYDSFNVLVAEGISLDRLGALIGVTRAPAIASHTDSQSFTGDDEDIIISGSVLENPTNNIRYVVTKELSLTLSDCISGSVKVQNVLNSTTYSLNVNGITYSYTSDVTATEAEILAGLKANIDADSTATWTAAVVGSELVVTTSSLNNIAITLLVNLLPGKVTNITSAKAENTGPIETPIGVVTILVTPTVDSTINLKAYITGRNQETDEEYRARILASQSVGAKATVEAITDNLLAINEVTAVSVTENNTDATVGGIPPHAFEVFIQGGDDNVIALSIWQTKPAGIASHGSTSIIIQDSQGNSQTIKFTRPTVINLAFKISYSLHTEESFPADGGTKIKTAIKEKTDALAVGEDVIPNRYYGPIFNAVSGINGLTVEVQTITNSGDVPNPANWQTTLLAIAGNQLGNTELIDITVVEV